MTRSARSGKRAQPSPPRTRSKRPKSPATAERAERQSQVTLQMREALHREPTRKAFESGMTMRGYIMNALRKSGLKVTKADLVDRRRR